MGWNALERYGMAWVGLGRTGRHLIESIMTICFSSPRVLYIPGRICAFTLPGRVLFTDMGLAGACRCRISANFTALLSDFNLSARGRWRRGWREKRSIETTNHCSHPAATTFHNTTFHGRQRGSHRHIPTAQKVALCQQGALG